MPFSIDTAQVDVPCPRCSFNNSVTIRQVRTRDVQICRGCRSNIQLDDYMNQVRAAERAVRTQVKALSDTLSTMGRLEIKL
jgi:hypothetical protein